MKNIKNIDSLRALAVISVVLFHLDVSWVKSSFLGVDIFFVISVFLITRIIIKDLSNDSFSIKNFYLRRMRRILPALITVLVFTTIFTWLILLPQDLKKGLDNFSLSKIIDGAIFYLCLDGIKNVRIFQMLKLERF
ncbi:acyltransferase family protein [Francisella sp. SYW-2]|uniref:acyltransferase family protein n=1 Tax=Francisella sp. SYW-2 TaxID=2610886 RepID=UPI00398D1265